jgi:alpha-D-xyloside xylohydrolase
MKNFTFFGAGLVSLLLTACHPHTPQVSQISDWEVLIDLPTRDASAPRRLRVQAVTDRVLHITATREAHFADGRSLIIVPQEAGVPLSYSLREDTVVVQTAALTLLITPDGAIRYADALTTAAPVFTPYEAGGKSQWSIRQDLTAVTGEPHYFGLGQHQSDEWDYAEREEELYQYNTKVSIPWVMNPAGGYALLWDGYSYARWGHAEPFAPLAMDFELRDADGEPGALTGRYVSAEGDTLTRREEYIGFDDIFSIAALPEGFPLQGSSVTYEGTLQPRHTGREQFSLYYAGYVRLYVDDTLVVPERWRAAWNPNTYKFALPVDSLRPMRLRIEWRPDGGTSYCALQSKHVPTDGGTISYWQEMNPELDYYFIAGENADSLIAGYRRLTGRAPIMPRWAMGYWQSRERYKTQHELISTLQEFRRRQFPIDNIVQDWSYWDEASWGSHDFDSVRYPSPRAMVDSVHALHGRFMISVWPKFYASTEHFDEFDREGWIYRQAMTDSIRDWIGPGYLGSFYDAYSDGARRLFWQQMYEHLYPLGVDAWWMDASEPNVRDCTPLAYRKALCGPTALGPSDEYFNAYALMNAEAIYEGQRSVDPARRVFLLTRSGFSGLQRYSTATWSGDIAARWEDLRAQITAGLNFSVSGVPFWSMDIGGFSVEGRYMKAQKRFDKTGEVTEDLREWRELYTRWFEFGAWVPLFRSHGQFPWREPWQVAPAGDSTYQALLATARLRYALLPYIYSLTARVHYEDYTLMRPLFMDFGATDPQVTAVHDQYLFGPSVMVCPVCAYGARSREVVFPAERLWYDLYSGRVAADTRSSGSVRCVVEAPYSRIPLFVPSGSILPVGPEVQYSDERAQDDVTLYVYAGRDGAFTLYDDDGVSYGYEEGASARIPLTYDDASGRLTVGRREGTFEGMPQVITFRIVYVTPEHPQGVGRARGAHVVRYDGGEMTIALRSVAGDAQ